MNEDIQIITTDYISPKDPCYLYQGTTLKISQIHLLMKIM